MTVKKVSRATGHRGTGEEFLGASFPTARGFSGAGMTFWGLGGFRSTILRYPLNKKLLWQRLDMFFWRGRTHTNTSLHTSASHGGTLLKQGTQHVQSPMLSRLFDCLLDLFAVIFAQFFFFHDFSLAVRKDPCCCIRQSTLERVGEFVAGGLRRFEPCRGIAAEGRIWRDADGPRRNSASKTRAQSQLRPKVLASYGVTICLMNPTNGANELDFSLVRPQDKCSSSQTEWEYRVRAAVSILIPYIISVFLSVATRERRSGIYPHQRRPVEMAGCCFFLWRRGASVCHDCGGMEKERRRLALDDVHYHPSASRPERAARPQPT